jgi:thioredoxin 1
MSVLTITSQNFEAEVMQSEKPVLLDFWAPWCGPCQAIAPIIEEIASEATHAKVGKINVDEEPQLAAAFGAMSIPLLAVVKNGEIVRQEVGAKPKEAILQMIG